MELTVYQKVELIMALSVNKKFIINSNIGK